MTVLVGLVLASPWILNFAFGWFAVSEVEAAVGALRDTPVRAGLLVVALLAVDSVLAIPSLVTVAIAGHLLGPFWGAACGLTGLVSAGAICFYGARFLGIERFVAAETMKRVRAEIGAIGPGPLLLARTVPVLPEALSAMAGIAGMRGRTYLTWYALGQAPYAIVGAWAGSVSTVRDPWPAVTALCVMLGLGAIGLRIRRRRRAG